MSHPAPPEDPQVPAPQDPAAQDPTQDATQEGSGRKKALGVVGMVAAAGVVGLGSWLIGPNGPEVGDCVASAGEASFDVVDCDSSEAEARVVGVEAETMTAPEFEADDTLCSDLPATEMVLWFGDIGQDGTVLCAEPVRPRA